MRRFTAYNKEAKRYELTAAGEKATELQIANRLGRYEDIGSVADIRRSLNELKTIVGNMDSLIRTVEDAKRSLTVVGIENEQFKYMLLKFRALAIELVRLKLISEGKVDEQNPSDQAALIFAELCALDSKVDHNKINKEFTDMMNAVAANDSEGGPAHE